MRKNIYNSKNRTFFLVHISLALFLLCFASVVMIFKDSSKNNVWQNFADYNFEIEHIIEDDILHNIANVSSAGQLAGAFNQIEKQINSPSLFSSENRIDVVKIANDIDMSGKNWSSVSLYNNAYAFSAEQSFVFDGNFKTIYNLQIESYNKSLLFANEKNVNEVGLFSSFYGTCKNLSFENVKIDIDNNDVSSVGVLAGHYEGEIDNVSVKSGNIDVINCFDDASVGGIVGTLVGNMNTGNNFMNIKSSSTHTAGGVGFATGTVKNFTNFGDVQTFQTSSYEKNVAGVVAKIQMGNVSGCSNNGEIVGQVSGSYASSATVNVGGIVGYAYNAPISACANYGYVSGGTTSVNKSQVGGIVGFTNSKVDVCYNKANVIAFAKTVSTTEKTTSITSNTKGGFYSGSKHGKTGPDNDNTYAMLKSGGSIKYSTKRVYAYAGGIAGFAYDIQNCYNKANVYGGYNTITVLVSCSIYLYGDKPGFSNYESTKSISYGETKFQYLYNGICGSTFETTSCYSPLQVENYYNTVNGNSESFEYQYDKKEKTNFKPSGSTITTTVKDVMYDIDITFVAGRVEVEFEFGSVYVIGTRPSGSGGVVVNNFYNTDNTQKNNANADTRYSISENRYTSIVEYSYYNSAIKSVNKTDYSTNFDIENFGGSSYWEIDPKINNGDPYPKNWYWKNSI